MARRRGTHRAAQGRAAEARALADQIVAVVADIDYPGIEFHARLDAAEGYRAAGRLEEAEALLGARSETAKSAPRTGSHARQRARSSGSGMTLRHAQERGRPHLDVIPLLSSA